MYHAVGNRCAVDFDELGLPIPVGQAISILEKKGFQKIDVDIVALARSLVGSAKYRRGAHPSEAPKVFDCSSLIQWLYDKRGVCLPRHSILQRNYGYPVNRENLKGGDVVFTSGFIDYYDTDPRDGVGHVGLATGDETVVHAANSKLGVIESPFDNFVGSDPRGIRRVIPDNHRVYTFITPPERGVRYSDEFRWIILQSLPR